MYMNCRDSGFVFLAGFLHSHALQFSYTFSLTRRYFHAHVGTEYYCIRTARVPLNGCEVI